MDKKHHRKKHHKKGHSESVEKELSHQSAASNCQRTERRERHRSKSKGEISQKVNPEDQFQTLVENDLPKIMHSLNQENEIDLLVKSLKTSSDGISDFCDSQK